MKAHYLLVIVLVLAAGYVLGRFVPAIGQKVGLP